ncbi:PerC family transcriptional regulator [Klebsiella aerogenes]|uniref:PerC family transcriptional regulator n=1 Tax=Klebsiella aerogenes TaxID=548 RepID=A0AAP9R2I3_KLEAE|nr:PerC family transcriptional regulator [Klebsiella aerogenes]QMR42869.1 PerC family transcriptional regulator [Klebsiella aerogenes]
MSQLIYDNIAEKLEASGLWRRASTRWLALMDRPGNTLAEQEWLRQRRQWCQAQLKSRKQVPEHLNIAALSKAASDTQKKMGIILSKRVPYRKNHLVKK